MDEVKVTIDGRQLSGSTGTTILELARANGIYIPTLCWHRDLMPSGNCRICVVEVEGSRTLVGSCHTPISEGMVIRTASPRVTETRQIVLELTLASHAGTCYMCDKANICELRKLAAETDTGLPRFSSKHRFHPREENSRYVIDLSKCVLCRRCVRACSELKRESKLAIGYRGFESKVVAGCDDSIGEALEGDYDACVFACPSGALTPRIPTGNREKARELVIRG